MEGREYEPTAVRAAAVRPSQRYRERIEGGRRPVATVVLDAISWAIVAIGLAVWLRAGANARYGPLLGLALPLFRWVFNPEYRDRVRSWRSAAWIEVEAWSQGADPIPWRAATAFVAVPYFLFQAANGGALGTYDTRPVTPTAVSLVRQGDLDLSEFEGLRPPLLRKADGAYCYCFQTVDGRIVSTYPPGMVPFALATVAPAYLLGADLDSTRTLQYLEKATAAAVSALALGLFFLAASRLGSARGGAATALLLATGSGLLTTIGLGLWQHGGVVVWLLLALLVEFAARSGKGPGLGATALQGFALAQMLSCRPTAGLLVAVFGLWVLLRAPRRGLWLAVFGAVSLAPLLAFHLLIYGDARGPSTITSSTTSALWTFFALWPTLGVLFSPARGVFVYQPWAVLAVAGGACWAMNVARGRRDDVEGPAGWRAFCLTAVVLHIILISAWWEWPGGYCYGSRLATDVAPLLALLATPVAAVMARSRKGLAAIGALALLGFLIHVPCIALEAHRWNFLQPRDPWNWTNPPFLYWS